MERFCARSSWSRARARTIRSSGSLENGYNWAALLDWYLAQREPALLEGLEHDPEAGSYAGYYLLYTTRFWAL